MKAIRIHEDGGPEVLRYEDVPDPVPAPDEVLVELRAASLNHLDVLIRQGLPSVPKPRILGADGAGVVAGTGERVVINPGIVHGGRMARHRRAHGRDARGADRRARATTCIPSRTGCRSRRRRRSRSSSRPRTGCSSRRRGCGPASGCSSGASAAASRPRRWRSRRRSARGSSSRRRATTKLARARELGADAAMNHAREDVAARVKEADGRRRARRRRARGRGDVDALAQRCAAGGTCRRLRRDDRPEPAGGAAPRSGGSSSSIYGSTMGTPRGLRGASTTSIAARPARPVVDEVFPLAEARPRTSGWSAASSSARSSCGSRLDTLTPRARRRHGRAAAPARARARAGAPAAGAPARAARTLERARQRPGR